MSTPAPIEIVRLHPLLADALEVLFREIVATGEDRVFHPHPFTRSEAESLCRANGRDEYYAVVQGGSILAYGMLRGWDQGYEIPSLGIYVRAEQRGKGIGRSLMEHLHAVARLRGSKRIRLKVYPDNRAARRLYDSLGYFFYAMDGGQLVGMREFSDTQPQDQIAGHGGGETS